MNTSNAANVIAIMGPTASGKTAAALEIARHIPSEIISVDSALIYRGMDIGTAKPSAEELASAPHHLIDIIDPVESYSVAQFRKDAERLVADIQARGKLPILVGGTMMYFNALKHGLDDLPGADPALRAELDAEAERIGVPGLHARLATLDPETAARLNPNDSQRIQRALEIITLSGQAMSALLARQTKPGQRSPCCRFRWNLRSQRSASAYCKPLRSDAAKRLFRGSETVKTTTGFTRKSAIDTLCRLSSGMGLS
jgi:tRNA dimethylallyltransferase